MSVKFSAPFCRFAASVSGKCALAHSLLRSGKKFFIRFAYFRQANREKYSHASSNSHLEESL
jgi:hypothetical protein